MPGRDVSSTDHLEESREIVWDALQMLERAQRILFLAGDRYVAQVWGTGVRNVLDLAERLTDLSGELSSVHIDMGRLVRQDRDRGHDA